MVGHEVILHSRAREDLQNTGFDWTHSCAHEGHKARHSDELRVVVLKYTSDEQTASTQKDLLQ